MLLYPFPVPVTDSGRRAYIFLVRVNFIAMAASAPADILFKIYHG